MNKRLMSTLATVVALIAGSSAFGQNYNFTSVQPASYSFGGGYGGCSEVGCGGCSEAGCGGCSEVGCGSRGCGVLRGMGIGGGGAFLDVEALLFRADPGRRQGPGTPEFANELAPRASIGYVGCGGLGIRFRFFDFAHDTGPLAAAGNRSILVDTYNMDLELFEELEVGCATSVEWSAGVRYNDFKFRDITLATNPTMIQTGSLSRFAGWGVIFGLQVNRQIGRGNFYARARWAILQDENSTDIRSINATNPMGQPAPWVDDIRTVTEIAIGYEVSGCTNFGVLTGRIGYEMQLWDDYLQFIGGRSDLGFDGLVLGLELAR